MPHQPTLPLPQSPPPVPPSPAAADARAEHLGGERVVLHADRALYWPGGAALFVADVHLGKAAAFRAGGVPLPRGGTLADLARLSALLEATGAQRLVILGDFLHAAAGRVAALDRVFVEWRQRHATVAMDLVRGNHDERAGDPPAAWNVCVVAQPHAMPPFLACHVPSAPRSGYALCGHVHPGVCIAGRGQQTERVPCFVLGARRAILPAFGGFTGLALRSHGPGDRVVAIAGRRLFVLPTG
jgi:uncharacterized protein